MKSCVKQTRFDSLKRSMPEGHFRIVSRRKPFMLVGQLTWTNNGSEGAEVRQEGVSWAFFEVPSTAPARHAEAHFDGIPARKDVSFVCRFAIGMNFSRRSPQANLHPKVVSCGFRVSASNPTLCSSEID
jgi:hypothetical protein